MIQECEQKTILWRDVSNDHQALVDRNKTKKEAECLMNYFEGKADGLIEAKRLLNSSTQ